MKKVTFKKRVLVSRFSLKFAWDLLETCGFEFSSRKYRINIGLQNISSSSENEKVPIWLYFIFTNYISIVLFLDKYVEIVGKIKQSPEFFFSELLKYPTDWSLDFPLKKSFQYLLKSDQILEKEYFPGFPIT